DAAQVALAEEGHALETLRKVGRSVASEFDLDSIVQRVTDAATELSGAASGAFLEHASDEEGPGWRLRATSGAALALGESFPMPADFPAGFRGEASVRSDDIRVDPRFAHANAAAAPDALSITSYLALPITSK